jgi:type I restriction enzyme M protein
VSIEKTLFAAADKMRGAMDAGEYKHIALGLLFLRYVSEAFTRRQALIIADHGDPEDRDEYLAENTFFVPAPARWSTLAAQSKDARIGVMVDNAMRDIEAENPSLTRNRHLGVVVAVLDLQISRLSGHISHSF